MRLLDLFSGEGGAALGYMRAGWEVTGIDRKPACGRHYPGTFVAGDALEYLAEHWRDYDAIHASPPCQLYSQSRHSHNKTHPDLVPPTREALKATTLPWIIENVPGAPLRTPVTLCGAYFGLTATDVDGTRLVLRRHRLFESNVWLTPTPCYCVAYRHRGYRIGGSYGGGSVSRDKAKIRRGGYTPAKAETEQLMGVPAGMMSRYGLRQAIPPAYTEYLGHYLAEHMSAGKYVQTDGLNPPGEQLALPWE